MESSVGDDLVMKAKLWEDVLKKDLGNVRHKGSFVAGVENYPLQKTMVYHNQNRIVAMREGKIHDEVHGNLLEEAGAFGGDRGEQGVEWMGVDLIGLTHGTSGDELADESGHAGPPIVFLKQGDGAEISGMSASKGFMNILDEGVSGRLGDVEMQFVIESALVEVPVLSLRLGERYGVCIHGSKGVDDELV